MRSDYLHRNSIVALLAAVALTGCQGGQASSANRGSAGKDSVPPAPAGGPSESFVGKTSGTPANLLKHLRELETRYRNAKQDDVETSHANLLAYSRASEQTADTMLALKDAPEEIRMTAAQIKLKSIRDRVDLEPAAFENFFKTADQLEHDNPQTKIAQMAAVARFETVSNAPPSFFANPQVQMDKSVAELIKLANVDPAMPDTAELLNRFGLENELRGDPKTSAKLFDVMAKRFPDEPMSKFAPGAVHRLESRGKPVADIAGKNFDGKPVDIKDFRGKIVLVDFWASWCKPCMSEMPDLKEMRRGLEPLGFEILGICIDEDARRGEFAVEMQKMGWPQIFDRSEGSSISGKLAVSYGIGQIPHKLLIDPDGVLVASGIDLKFMAVPLANLLKTQKEKLDKAKAEKSAAAAPAAESKEKAENKLEKPTPKSTESEKPAGKE